MHVLVINSGSSSLKYKLYDLKIKESIATGLVERIGDSGPSNYVFNHDGHGRLGFEQTIKDHKEALKLVLNTLQSPEYGALKNLDDIYAVGHRVLHGTEKYSDSVVVTTKVINTLKNAIELGPLHMPANIMGIEACQELIPGVVQVAVFDTAFHQTLPEKAFLYAVPYELYEKHGIRKYGFHGTSHRYLSERVAEVLGKPIEKLRVITLHLGNGCSMAAVQNGRCIDTTMGLTPLEGLVMGTRSGDLDPALVRFLAEKLTMSIVEIDDLLNLQSGLLGISGVGSDMRDIHSAADAGHKRAKLAYEVFIYRIRKYLGAFVVAMGGVDALVFAGGIGENDNLVRKDVCRDLEWLGIEIDDELNSGSNGTQKTISKKSSRVQVMVIPTDEELVIAQDALRLAKSEYAIR